MKDAKPFLKWVGGKTQLLPEIRKFYPFSSFSHNIYIEPFVGGGAILFDILNQYENIKSIYINDSNPDLYNCYVSIRDNVGCVIQYLKGYQNEYLSLSDKKKKDYYNQKRDIFNTQSLNLFEKASLFIFLNKTCFNGLYRVNKQGKFNVPAGTYKNPLICDEENLRNVSQKLHRVCISNIDYNSLIPLINENCFIYLDPPYLPISKTSYFTSYTNDKFNIDNQKELAEFVHKIHKKGAKFLLSNSDSKNIDENNTFFDDLYKDYHIYRVKANRSINSNASNRGKITELLITNIE